MPSYFGWGKKTLVKSQLNNYQETQPASGAPLLTVMLEVIRAADDLTKARIWCELNGGVWPQELAPKPDGLDEMTHKARHTIVWRLMSEVMEHIEYKDCLREWNKKSLPGEQFDDWWNSQKGQRNENTER